jgi:hypothetical protein
MNKLKMKSRNPLSPYLLLAASLLLTACGAGSGTMITSQPSGATIRINQGNIGTTPVSHNFDFRNLPVQSVSATLQGYLEETIVLDKEHPRLRRGQLHLVLEQDEAFRMTVESEATNRWLRVQINSALTPEQAWQRVVDSVTTTYDSIEQMDQAAGYVRTSPKARVFQRGSRGNHMIRTYLVGAIASSDPLTYRFQIRSQVKPVNAPDHLLEDYNRIFPEDAQLIQELQMRLGIR